MAILAPSSAFSGSELNHRSSETENALDGAMVAIGIWFRRYGWVNFKYLDLKGRGGESESSTYF